MNRTEPKKIERIKARSVFELDEFLNRIENLEPVRAAIFGLADDAFETDFSEAENTERKIIEKIIEKIEQFPKPLIFVAEKKANNFLFEVCLAAHLSVAAESTVFVCARPENLQKEIGSKNLEKLRRLEKSGKLEKSAKIEKSANPENSGEIIFGAEEALSLGVINEIARAESPEKTALRMAEKIAELAPLAVRAFLRAVNEGSKQSLENGLELELELFRQMFETLDMREGTRAFFEKRKPLFTGK